MSFFLQKRVVLFWCVKFWPFSFLVCLILATFQGRIQDFKLGGGGALKKMAPSGGRRENCWGISCEKSRFYAKKSYFFQFYWGAGNFWGISCEKSRFYAKKSYFFQFYWGAGNFWGISCEKSRFYGKKSYLGKK